MSTATDVEQFFAGGAKTAKFEDRAYGTVIGGEIITDPVMRQQRDYETDELMVYPDGNPMMQMIITVQAQAATDDDDGARSFYVRGQLKQAIGEALRKAGEKAPRRGGKLWVKYLSDEPVTLKNGKRGNDKKIHAAKYEPPAQAAAGQFFQENIVPLTNPASGSTVATPAASIPAGIDPQVWARMDPAQQAQMVEALGADGGQFAGGKPSASGAAVPGRFSDEPPF